MGLFADLLLEKKCEKHEKDIKEAYSLGFRDGRLCPAEPRPCEVDGKPCLFHRWIEEDVAMLKFNAFMEPEDRKELIRIFSEEKTVSAGCSMDIIRHTFALVEFPDGSVGKVDPELVQFIDREGAST